MENGVTAFAPPPAPTYRFVIASNAEKLKITLEDLTSKKQWSTGILDDKEYLTSTNKIPNASLTDYVKVDIFYLKGEGLNGILFLFTKDNNSNQGDKDSSQDDIQPLDPRRIRRKLTPLEDDAFQLELFVKIRIFQSAWTAKYLFKMEPVTLAQIDILEAKLRDVEDELESTKKGLEEEKQQRGKVEEQLNEFGTKLSEMKEELANAKKPKPFVYAK
ncbi:hypothetical protein PHMEG_00032187 [Phytophthora megakarya]|uniref:Uncharacterized protein n=1 Tax=Phytophthora megakarya TaxID=4795 RepID=A0A225UWW4_9STRA|nr:hypothetical protein PHMEG_00032187 [Phytophthora megakarya]